MPLDTVVLLSNFNVFAPGSKITASRMNDFYNRTTGEVFTLIPLKNNYQIRQRRWLDGFLDRKKERSETGLLTRSVPAFGL